MLNSIDGSALVIVQCMIRPNRLIFSLSILKVRMTLVSKSVNLTFIHLMENYICLLIPQKAVNISQVSLIADKL